MGGTPWVSCPQGDWLAYPNPAVSHLRRSAAALRSRPPPPWPACPARALRPQPRYSLARGRGIAGAARATVPAGFPVQSSQALFTLAPRSPSPASACPAPRPPPSAPSGGPPRAATSGSTVQYRLQGALDAAVVSWVLPCLKVCGISRFSLFSGIGRVPDYESEGFQYQISEIAPIPFGTQKE